jgi:hypothetical protein
MAIFMTFTASNNSFPMPTKEDTAGNVGKIATGIVGSTGSLFLGIPGLDIIASELYSKVIIPSLDKRRINWLNDLASRLINLEKRINNFKVSDLSKNQLFLTVITQATQIAIRNHQDEKLEVLRNVVINSTRPLFGDYSLYLMFLQWIDAFTPWHIRILNYLASPSMIIENGRIDMRQISVPIVEKIKNQFPSNEINLDLIIQVLMDLSVRGLIDVKSQFTIQAFRSMLGVHVTEMGNNFLKFISE